MPPTHALETPTRNLCRRNMHVCRSILYSYRFFSVTSFLHAFEHSSISEQKMGRVKI